MAAFTDEQIDWGRIDVQALLVDHGLAVIDDRRHASCSLWLQQQGYQVVSLDCAAGFETVVEEMGRLFHWEEQFGYRLAENSGNLNALRDGFHFEVPDTGGLVFELVQPDVVMRENPCWMLGLLSIAAEHSLRHLACGRRFFSLLVLPEQSPMIGASVDSMVVPGLLSTKW